MASPLTELFGFPPSGTISPSVRLLEKDFSAYNPGISFSKTALVGFASKGPLNVPTRVFNHDDLFRKFGFPDPSVDHGSYLVYSAIEALRSISEAWIVRVGVTDEADWDNFAKTAYVEVFASGQPAIIRANNNSPLSATQFPGPFVIDSTSATPNNKFRFAVNGSLYNRTITIPDNNTTGYTVEELVDAFNLQFVDDDGIEAFIYTDDTVTAGTDTIAFRTTKIFGSAASIEILSVKDAIYETIGLAQGMTAATLEGEADRYPEGSSVVAFNFTGLTDPTLKLRVVGTGDSNIDNIEQTIPFEPLTQAVLHDSGVTGPIVTAAEIATYINWFVDNPSMHSYTVPGGFRAEAVAGMVNLITASQTDGSNDIRGRTAQIQVKFNSNIMDEALGFSNNSVFGTTDSAISSTHFLEEDIDSNDIDAADLIDVDYVTGGVAAYEVGKATGAPYFSGEAPLIMTIWADSPGLAGNETQVQVSNDSEGKIVLQIFNGGVYVESHSNLDRNFTDTNNPFYIERYINGYSDYIYVDDESSVVGSPTPGTYQLGLTTSTQGSDGYPYDINGIPDPDAIDDLVVGDAQLGTGIQALSEPEKIDIDLVAAPGLTSTEVINALIDLCSVTRRDCMAIIDPPFGLDSVSVNKWHNGAHALNNVRFDTSYAALYWPWVKVRDPFNKLDVWVPPSGPVIGVYGQSERLSEVWYAPAGLRRGKIVNAIELERFAFLRERDSLYGNRNAVNVLVDFPDEGPTVFGQKTLQRRATALDRVNVRRLMLFLEKEVRRVSRFLLFEPHDEILRQEFVRTATRVVADAADKRGVAAYFIKCDEELNPPEVIDRNEMRAKIGIQPIKAAEFIFIEFTINRTGSFEESVVA